MVVPEEEAKEMSASTSLDARPEASRDAEPESAKHKQILEGARRVFFASGFAAASMGEIAREAKVSKGTLYVYFDSKEALFAALIDDAKRETAERAMQFDVEDPDVGGVLTEFAIRLIEKLSAPQHVAMVRMVIGAAEQFPDLAQVFYEAGPNHGRRRLTEYLIAQQDRGRLVMPDPELAAWQFLGMCCHPVTVHVVLAGQEPPDPARVRTYAESAVVTFLASFGAATG